MDVVAYHDPKQNANLLGQGIGDGRRHGQVSACHGVIAGHSQTATLRKTDRAKPGEFTINTSKNVGFLKGPYGI